MSSINSPINSKIRVTDLDFDAIKANLVKFLSGQEALKDYDFTGSALNTLVDVLAYNTHYNALYTNLAINEQFLDSASKRESVVSIANNFGYTPRSARSARAIIRVSVTNKLAEALTLPKWTPFNTVIDGLSYSFRTLTDYNATKDPTSGNFIFDNVEIYEGVPKSMIFVCTEPDQSFVIPFADIDTSTMIVSVQSTVNVLDSLIYSQVNNITSLGADSRIYYLKELDDGTYKISFGSNNLGKPISPGNVVNVTGLVTGKDLANTASSFSYGGSTNIGTAYSVITILAASGGSDKESRDEIKNNVSNHYFNQNRAISPIDFISIIRQYWDDVGSISVWGGENNSPPVYGKVFISMTPKSSLKDYFSITEETYIRDTILKPKCVPSISIEFVRPSYIDLEVTSNVYYDKTKTVDTADSIKNSIIGNIISYNNTYLNAHDGIFRISKFGTIVDSTDKSISGNITNVRAFVKMSPIYNVSTQYYLNIVNPIYQSGVPEEAFVSTGFKIDSSNYYYYLTDDGAGKIKSYRKNITTGVRSEYQSDVGTISYSSGIIDIPVLNVQSIEGLAFYFIVKTQSSDVISVRNHIVRIPSTKIKVNMIDDNSSTNSLFGNTNYTFTSGRN